MIKRVIFDLDNTLIKWKDEYWNAVNRTFDELNLKYSIKDINKIKQAVDYYEDGRYDRYDKKLMHKTLEKFLEYELPENFVDIWMKNLGDCAPSKVDSGVLETLKYLKSKYDLVILTNWFKNSQEERLKTCKINDFFTNIYAAENFKMKPDKEAFMIAMGNYKNNECIVIGDSFKIDILGALNSNIKSIYLDNSRKITEGEIGTNKVKVIYELIDIVNRKLL